MKRICACFLVLVAIFCLMPKGYAENLESVVVAVTTDTVTGDDYVWGANTLVISSYTPKSLIKEVDISVDTIGQTQTVTLWDGFSLNTSSTNVTKIWEVVIPSGTPQGCVYSKTFRYGDRGFLKADYGLAVTKSSTGNSVVVSLQYK